MFSSTTIALFLFVLIFLLFSPQQIHSQLHLADLNTHFLTAYRQARSRLLSRIDPLIISNGDNLTLLHRGQRTTVLVIPPIYHDLKAISHIPLAIYLRLFNIESSNDLNLSFNQTIELKSYLQDIRIIRNSLNFSKSPENIFETQLKIINLSIDFLRSILKSKHLNQTKLKEFCHQSRTLFTLNINRAVHVQLDRLHSIVYPWYTQLFNRTERQTVKVLILGPKTPRIGFIVKLYFYALLGGQRREGKRVIYAESVFEEQTAMNILGSWLLDEYAGEIFYDDPSRLHRDLMMDEATIYIKQLFKSTKN